MSAPDSDRAAVIAHLRAVADLMENDETIPVPSNQDITFWAGRAPGDPTANAVRIAFALAPAGGWKAEERHYGDSGFLELTAQIAPGWKVSIEVPIADAATEAGQKTVTIWEPKPEIAALLAPEPERGQS